MQCKLGRVATLTAMAGVAAALAACGGGSGPVLSPIEDQVIQVGAELSLELRASDADGDDLSFDYSVDLPDIRARASLTKTPNGSGIFRWTPLAADVGQWYFDFTASDGDGTARQTVLIDVRSAVGSASAPLFRSPLGTGTTLDLEDRECLDLEILLEDQDDADVVIAQEEPLIEGATLEAVSGLQATWQWCPTEAQVDADNRYTLTLSADDQDNPKTFKTYLIVLRAPTRPDCPGDAPVLTHTAANETTSLSLVIGVDITDDQGLKQPPLFYYSATDPGADPDLGAMTQVSMLLIDGTMSDGVWAAEVPNPVAASAAGAMDDLYYVIVADDDDDPMGSCDHSTQLPFSGAFEMTVTSAGGGDAGLCGGCTADVQCGGGGNLCVVIGTMGASYCLDACTSSSQCESGFSCSPAPVSSVNGAMGRQCVPDIGSCAGGGVCQDDSYEDNDSRSQASGNPALAPDLYQFTSCPAAGGVVDDEDWFKVVMPAEGQYEFAISGDGANDLDLAIYRSDGTKVTESTSLTDNETIVQCLDDLTYYARVFAYGTAQNDYVLDWSATGLPCSLTCEDLAGEPDDTTSQAFPVPTSDYMATDRKICPNDDDFYELDVSTGDQITVDLTFAQVGSSQDLDIHLYNAAGQDLTPCPPCDTANGQSGDANETFNFTVPATCGASCTYFVVVRGYDDASNEYDIRIRVQ